MCMADCVLEIETQKGIDHSPAVLRLAQLLDKVAEEIAKKGREDSAKARQPLSIEAIQQWCKRAITGNPQFVEDIAYIMHSRYMEGYHVQKEDCHDEAP